MVGQDCNRLCENLQRLSSGNTSSTNTNKQNRQNRNAGEILKIDCEERATGIWMEQCLTPDILATRNELGHSGNTQLGDRTSPSNLHIKQSTTGNKAGHLRCSSAPMYHGGFSRTRLSTCDLVHPEQPHGDFEERYQDMTGSHHHSSMKEEWKTLHKYSNVQDIPLFDRNSQNKASSHITYDEFLNPSNMRLPDNKKDSVSGAVMFTRDFSNEAFPNSGIKMSVAKSKLRPKSCRAFYHRNIGSTLQEYDQYCTSISRPKSTPIVRKRDSVTFRESHQLRRGNVPQYVSIVSPMPVHLRPGTGLSSGFTSTRISMVTEDLLVSAGTHGDKQEWVDSGEDTASELGMGYRVPTFPEGYGGSSKDELGCSSDDVNAASATSTLQSFNDAEPGTDNVDDGDSSKLLNTNDLAIENMVNGHFDSTALSSYDQDGGSSNLEDAEDKDGDIGTTLDSQDVIDNERPLDNNDQFDNDESQFGKDNFDLGRHGDDDDDVRGIGTDEGDVIDSSNIIPDYLEDSSKTDFAGGTPTSTPTSTVDGEDVPNTDLQVTFSEPLTTTERRPSANADDQNGVPKSILKNDDEDAKNRIYEFDVDRTVVKNMTSPTGGTGSVKPVIERNQLDGNDKKRSSLSNTSKDISRLQKPNNKNTNFDDQDEFRQSWDEGENSSDGEFYSSDRDSKTRRSRPRKNIYAKRANLKTPKEKFRKRRTSDDDNDDVNDDEVAGGESTLLMEQILEQEKRLREGMKPWLKGRLALSQQNSRFEIPMDVRLLENMTPMNYLSNYCVISKRRKALYKHVFQKMDRNRDGFITFTELDNALKDVHIGVLNSEHIDNIVKMVNIDKEGEFDLKQFSGVAAFSERISCKDQLSMESLNNLDGQKEMIESADFCALSWKLHDIHVNPAVKKVLDLL